MIVMDFKTNFLNEEEFINVDGRCTNRELVYKTSETVREKCEQVR